MWEPLVAFLAFLIWENGNSMNRLSGLVNRVPGYRSGDPGFDSRRCQIFLAVLGLERGSLSLGKITGEPLERKVVAPV
jgi:hypothetical protein